MLNAIKCGERIGLAGAPGICHFTQTGVLPRGQIREAFERYCQYDGTLFSTDRPVRTSKQNQRVFFREGVERNPKAVQMKGLNHFHHLNNFRGFPASKHLYPVEFG
jgi:hypothetical protein